MAGAIVTQGDEAMHQLQFLVAQHLSNPTLTLISICVQHALHTNTKDGRPRSGAAALASTVSSSHQRPMIENLTPRRRHCHHPNHRRNPS